MDIHFFFGNDCHEYLHSSATHICQSVVAKSHLSKCRSANKGTWYRVQFSVARKSARAHCARTVSYRRRNQYVWQWQRQVDIFLKIRLWETKIGPKQLMFGVPQYRFHARLEVWTWFLGGSGRKRDAYLCQLRVRGTIDPVQKIRVMMKEELTVASPRVRAVEPTRTRQETGEKTLSQPVALNCNSKW